MRFCFLIVLFVASVSSAQTVYKSVQDGVPSFSDTPPASGEVEAIELDVPEAPDDGLLEERLAAMRETTDRMADDRREREQHRAELKALNTPDPAPVVVEQQPMVVGSYWPSSYYRPHRPRPPFRPNHPGTLPTTPTLPATPVPGWSVMKGGNSQLMRPIVSGRN